MPPEKGQIWKNRNRKPTSVFLVHKVWTKEYKDGSARTRVTGVLVVDDIIQMKRDLDIDSMTKMFPYLMFGPKESSPDRV